MNSKDGKYTRFSLCREMLETIGIIRNLSPDAAAPFLKKTGSSEKVLLTGEGSSRIFPGRNAINFNMRHKQDFIYSSGSYEAIPYDLSDTAVIGLSNSGKTKELAVLFDHLSSPKKNKCGGLCLVTAAEDSPLIPLSDSHIILSGGKEKAVAATKSVVEQALILQAFTAARQMLPFTGLENLAEDMSKVLTMPVDPEIAQKLAQARRIYFAGPHTGVAEELTLKTNEIARKPSSYLEGTYLLHGVEEVLSPEDAVILIDPFPDEYEMIQKCIVSGTRAAVIAISDRENPFAGIRIPINAEFRHFLQLAAGWNLLVETGLVLNIDLDKPVRARKIGNAS